jgi:uncharacterized protein (TIGR00255 family)
MRPHGPTFGAPMILSMTGFGRAEGVASDRKVTVEVRSLNSKQLDLLIRLPGPFKDQEVEVRQLVAEQVVRGKVEVYVSMEGQQTARRTTFDRELVSIYHKELSELVREVAPQSQIDVLAYVLRMPDVMVTASEHVDEEEWAGVGELVLQALKDLADFRLREGRRLADDLVARVGHIGTLLNEIATLDAERMDRTRDRIKAKLAELKVNVNEDRFEQELVYYLEKLDITEEKVRLNSHCTYFMEVLNEGAQQGRKLSFIGQEMGREINTIGSKANDATIQRLVVVMKDELEKVKEQVLNVL